MSPKIYKCDFCEEPHPMCEMKCLRTTKDHTVHSPFSAHHVVFAAGWWAACDDCLAVLTCENPEELCAHSVRKRPPLPGITQREHILYILRAQEAFWAGWDHVIPTDYGDPPDFQDLPDTFLAGENN